MIGSAVSSPTDNFALENAVTTVVDIMTDIYSRDGNQNLKTIEDADKFTDWMYSEVKPYLRKNILEIGSGIGTYSEKIICDFKDSKLTFSDIDRKYVTGLKTKFKIKKIFYFNFISIFGWYLNGNILKKNNYKPG